MPFTLSNMVVDYVGIGIVLTGTQTSPYQLSHLTLTRCGLGVMNFNQPITLTNSIVSDCGAVVLSEISATTTIAYSLLDPNIGLNYLTNSQTSLVEGPGMLYAEPQFVEFPQRLWLKASSPAVDAGDPASPYQREFGYNGGRVNMGAYGNTIQATGRVPIEQMDVTLQATPLHQVGGLGQPLSYTLTLENSGSISETYRLHIPATDLRASFSKEGRDTSQYYRLAPQARITVPLWVWLGQTAASVSRTVTVRAANAFIATKIEVTAQTGQYQENQGNLVFEAEHGRLLPDTSTAGWLLQDSLPDYVGSGYVTAWPDQGKRLTSTYTATTPRLGYRFNLTSTGSYTVWLRGYAPNGAGDSIYLALDDQSSLTLTGFTPRQWAWSQQTSLGMPAVLNITQPGEHTLYLWQREDGLRIDRIWLTNQPVTLPIGNGPAESQLR